MFNEHGRSAIDVNVFTAPQAAAYMTKRLNQVNRGGILEDHDTLARELGRLPLALAQASAMIQQSTHLTCSLYRQRFADQTRALSQLLPATATAGDYPHTVATTVALSLTAIAEHDDPAGTASTVARLLAVLHPDGIPTAALMHPAVHAAL